jgi:uncharacterized protein (TIGR02300 family)
MPKEEWGVKRVCPKCSVRFYDLQRDPMTCPSCGHSFSLESLNAGSGRTLVADKAEAKAKTAPREEGEEEVVLEEEDVDLDEDILDDEDEDNVSLDDIADVSSDDEED